MQALDFAQLPQQLRQQPLVLREIRAVAAGILGDYNQFLGAVGCQNPGLVQNVVHLAAAVLASQIGNDAEGAAVVAALGNLDVREMLGSGDHPAHFLLRRVNGAEIHNLVAGEQLLNGGNDLGIASRAQDAVHLGHFLEDIPLVALGQAPCHQNFAHLALRFQRGSLQNIVDGLTFCRVDEAAGIDHHHVAARDALVYRMSGFLHPEHHPFAVHLILGAAKRNKSDCCHYSSSGKSSVSRESSLRACRIAP